MSEKCNICQRPTPDIRERNAFLEGDAPAPPDGWCWSCGSLGCHAIAAGRLVEMARAAEERAAAAEAILRELRDQRAHDDDGCSSHCILSASNRPARIDALLAGGGKGGNGR